MVSPGPHQWRLDWSVCYVDVESQGRNEVKPSQTSPGAGQSKVPGGEERKNPHQRDQHSQSVRILSPCLVLSCLAGPTTSQRAVGGYKATEKCGVAFLVDWELRVYRTLPLFLSASPALQSIRVYFLQIILGPARPLILWCDGTQIWHQTRPGEYSASDQQPPLITRGCFNGSTDQHNLMLPFSLANTEISPGDKSGLVNAPTTQCTRFKILTLNLLCFKGLNGYLKK